mgnify:CR=1 FL=1
MGKKRIPANVDIPTVEWLDRQISKGVYASYSHAIRLALKLLRKTAISTIKFKKPNSVKTEVTQENVKP